MDQYDEIRAQLLAKQEELNRRLENIKSNITRGRSADSQEQAQELENADDLLIPVPDGNTEYGALGKAGDEIHGRIETRIGVRVFEHQRFARFRNLAGQASTD